MRSEQKLSKQQKKKLSLDSNKEELLEILLEDWSSNERHIRQIGEKEVFITVKVGAYKIYKEMMLGSPYTAKSGKLFWFLTSLIALL